MSKEKSEAQEQQDRPEKENLPVEHKPEKETGPKVFKDVVIKGRLVITSDDGKSSIIMQAMDGVAGLWVRSETPGDKYPESLIAIYDDATQGPCIGFYKDVKEENLAMTCAISMGADGYPQIQVPNGRGGYGFIGLTELLDKLKPEWR